MEKHLVRTSKFLSLVLRHDPGRIGLTLDAAGWASVPELLRLAGEAGHPLPKELLCKMMFVNEASPAINREIRIMRGET